MQADGASQIPLPHNTILFMHVAIRESRGVRRCVDTTPRETILEVRSPVTANLYIGFRVQFQPPLLRALSDIPTCNPCMMSGEITRRLSLNHIYQHGLHWAKKRKYTDPGNHRRGSRTARLDFGEERYGEKRAYVFNGSPRYFERRWRLLH